MKLALIRAALALALFGFWSFTASAQSNCPSVPAADNLGTRILDGICKNTESPAVPAGSATAANQASTNTKLDTLNTNVGAVADSACTTDNGSCSSLSLLKRIAQRITSMITALGTPFQAGGALGAGEAVIGATVGKSKIASDVFTAAATAAYVSGDLIANHATAGSVTPMTFAVARAVDKEVHIRRVRVKTTDVAALNAVVRVHFFNAAPTVANGDSGVYSPTNVNYVGCFDVTIDKAGSDVQTGIGVPCAGSEITTAPVSGTVNVRGFVEARSSFTATDNTKTWTVEPEALQN